ncbi:MAG: pyridoxine 5'-phosphate synthase, partial [Planctomycetaceae bacterium]|nr:pyridoxine 5'-phosphate synthase [Planctomycetaceae bacterium]
SAGVVVSGFIEPIADQVRASADCGMGAVELWTGAYAHAATPAERARTLAELEKALALGHELGLEVHAGHGLTYRNVAEIAAVPGFSEFNIGHSIVARAVLVGMRRAVREMKTLLVRHGPRENN